MFENALQERAGSRWLLFCLAVVRRERAATVSQVAPSRTLLAAADTEHWKWETGEAGILLG